MIVVIDGYNMLRQIFPGIKGKLDAQRNYLIQQLSSYKAQKKDSIRDIVIVFDAGPINRATREVHHGIVVMYSGQSSNADEWIIQYVQKHKEQELIIVTKDRGVIQACKPYNIQELDGQSFYQIIRDTLLTTNSAPTNKITLYDQNIQKYDQTEFEDEINHKIDRSELDFLMQKESSFIQEKDEVERKEEKKSKAKALSKKEKKLYAALKKLS